MRRRPAAMRKGVCSDWLALVLPLAGYLAAGQMTEQFFPPSDRNMFTIELHLDPASGISATRERVRRVDAVLAEAVAGIGGDAP